MKKVLFISCVEVVPWGGSEELWHYIANRLLDKGYDLKIDRVHWNPVPTKLQQLMDRGAKVLYRPNYHIQRSKLDIAFKVKNRFFNNGLLRRLKGISADVLVISQGGTFDHYLFKIIPFLMSTNIPFIIISQHNPEVFYLSDTDREKIKRIFYKARKIYFVAKRNRQVVERLLATSLENADIISNPIKIEQSVSLPFPQDNCLKMACVARLDTFYKGQDVLLQVLSSDKWKVRSWELSLFGSGPHDKYLQELVIFYGLEKKVFLRGHVDNLTDVWAQHHLLVLPSHSEGTPLALLEAAFCSRAAVVTDVGGNAEVVKDGVSGFIASASSVKALDEALERAWSNRENLFQMGLEARKVVEQDIGYNNFDSIVEEILNA